MRLYRERTEEERGRVVGMVGKKDVRRWLEEQGVVARS
jgi:cyclin L